MLNNQQECPKTARLRSQRRSVGANWWRSGHDNRFALLTVKFGAELALIANLFTAPMSAATVARFEFFSSLLMRGLTVVDRYGEWFRSPMAMPSGYMPDLKIGDHVRVMRVME